MARRPATPRRTERGSANRASDGLAAVQRTIATATDSTDARLRPSPRRVDLAGQRSELADRTWLDGGVTVVDAVGIRRRRTETIRRRAVGRPRSSASTATPRSHARRRRSPATLELSTTARRRADGRDPSIADRSASDVGRDAGADVDRVAAVRMRRHRTPTVPAVDEALRPSVSQLDRAVATRTFDRASRCDPPGVDGRRTSLLRVGPGGAEADVDDERDAQLGDVLHRLAHERLGRVALAERAPRARARRAR